MKSQTALRAISALVAIAALIVIYHFFSVPGLIAVSCVIALLSHIEYNRIAFVPLDAPYPIRIAFFMICAALLLITTMGRQFILEAWGAATTVYISAVLWLVRGRLTNDRILALLATSGLGIVYLGFFPSFAIKTLMLERGGAAFATLLAMVFTGDTAAYFGGRWFGRAKLMESISPKKTWAGSIAGAIGSIAAGWICGLFVYTDLPATLMAAIALPVAFVAQSGDLFISLIKRVAQVKDSGTIMPGHGGFLDRLDGVFFGAPVFYALVVWSFFWFPRIVVD